MKRVEWQVQEAKAEFSALIIAAEKSGPQSVTKHGRRVAVVLSEDDYARLSRRPKSSLAEFFANSPLAELDLARDRGDIGRDVDF
jgi:prevent-host-death family protein